MTPKRDTTWPAERITALRLRLDMTQQEMATALGIATATISRWERKGFKPSRMAEQKLDAFERAQIRKAEREESR